MHRWSRSTSNESGSASLEFIAATAILLVPLLYLTIALADVQNQTLGAQAIGRHASRVLADGGSTTQVESVVASLAGEYGIDPTTVELSVTCAGGGTCPRAGALISVIITARADLPLVPALFGTRAAVPIGATAVQKISDYAGDEP